MVATVGSAAGSAPKLNFYIGSSAAHDQDGPSGPSDRAEFVSSIGDCTPETFISDMRRTRETYGKTALKVETYHFILSHSHEELDPSSEYDGWIAHQFARAWAAESFPGRQAKLTTQRDNGRWEYSEAGDDVWVPGKWHTHVQVASVAEREVTLRWTDKDGVEQVKHYPAGRAIDGDIKNIHRLRGVTDRVVERELRYDNKRYMDECQKASRGDRVGRADLAQRKNRGYSDYDQVRSVLRNAQAQATSWTDYTDRAAADGVMVRGAGARGASYAWIGEDGSEQKARARKLGDAYMRSAVEEQCEMNVAALARGEQLEVPEPVLVPAASPREDRPVPEYTTRDGKPPWEDDKELAAYAERIEREGGTYEGMARAGIDEAFTDSFSTDVETLALVAEENGVEVVDGENGELFFAVDTPEGRTVMPAENLGAAYADRQALGHEINLILEGLENERREARGAEGPSRGSGERVRGIDHAQIDRGLAERERPSSDHGTERDDAGRGADRSRDGDVDLADQRRRLGELAAGPERAEEQRFAAGSGQDTRGDDRRGRGFERPGRSLRDAALDRADGGADRDDGFERD